MQGDLAGSTAAAICRELAAGGETGVLRLVGADGPGELVLENGEVVSARSPTPRGRVGHRLVGAGRLEADDLEQVLRDPDVVAGRLRVGAALVDRGLVPPEAVHWAVEQQVIDAAFELLGWHYGSYAYFPGSEAHVEQIPVRVAVDDLLHEVELRQAQWARLSAAIPDLEAVPRFREGTGEASTDLQPDEFTLLASIDGQRSIRALADDLGYGTFEAARVVFRLLELGVVEVPLPEDEVGSALDEAMTWRPDAGLAPQSASAPEPVASHEFEPPHELRPVPRPEPAPEPEAETEAEPEPEPEPEHEPAPEPQPEPAPDRRSIAAEFASLRLEDPRSTTGDQGAGPTTAPSPDDLEVDLPVLPDLPDPPTAPPDEADEPSSPQPPTTGPRSPARERARKADRDVSEFLRELSRLSADETNDRPSATSPPANDDRDQTADDDEYDRSGRRRRRGLFGRG